MTTNRITGFLPHDEMGELQTIIAEQLDCRRTLPSVNRFQNVGPLGKPSILRCHGKRHDAADFRIRSFQRAAERAWTDDNTTAYPVRIQAVGKFVAAGVSNSGGPDYKITVAGESSGNFAVMRLKITSGLEERIYVLTDLNHNVTGVTDVFGVVQERFAYDPYGAATVLTSAFGASHKPSNSAVDKRWHGSMVEQRNSKGGRW